MEVKPGYKQTEVGVIPEEWAFAAIGDVTDIRVGRDLREETFSNVGDSTYRYPVYSNTVAGLGLYGFYSIPEYEGDSLTVVGRGVGLGTAFARTGGYGAIGRLLVLLPGNRADARFLTTYINERVSIFVETGGIPQLTGIQFSKYQVALPPLPEQRAIATVLSEVDELLGALDRLIAKKRDLKQAAMQQLLTGQTRLPGFQGEWKVKTLGEVFVISAGKSKSAFVVPDGDYWVVDMGSVSIGGQLIVSKQTNYCGDFLQIGDLVMPKDDIGGGNIIGKVGFIDADSKYVLGDHVYCLRAKEGNPRFLAYTINSHPINRALRKKVIGSAQLGLGRRGVIEQEISFPPLPEQTAIAGVLSDMDEELAVLEQRQAKTRALKQGMMQELLTGRTRLVDS